MLLSKVKILLHKKTARGRKYNPTRSVVGHPTSQDQKKKRKEADKLINCRIKFLLLFFFKRNN